MAQFLRGRDAVRWNGWGYKDTAFQLNHHGQVQLSGNRYTFSGTELPSLRAWMEDKIGIDVKDLAPPQADMPKLPAKITNDEFMAEIKGHYAHLSTEDEERLFHGHGHTCQEVYKLRYGTFERVPDVVVYPGCHEDVEAIVKAAHKHNVVIIPFGGGTSVSEAVLCPVQEKRMIVSLDMKRMDRIKKINHKSMLACIEAGAIGKSLEAKLNRYGLTLGHEPDSWEFSSLGGWVATRASGMKKNKYGNIEDIIVKIKMVTPMGTIEKGVQVPRISTGPDVHHMLMGSEGILGVVTEAVVRLRPLPKVRKYGSLIFPDFDSGVNCMHEIAIKRLQPASIRLVDNMQFQFGQALKPEQKSWTKEMVDKVKKWYVVQHRGFDPERMVAATLLLEGTRAEVREQERRIYEVAAKYGGMKAGEENGIRGYFLTYVIAYLRDFGMNYHFMAESFETSVPWDQVHRLCRNVKDTIGAVAKQHNVPGTPFVSCRVTQLYDTGAAVYFYFGFLYRGLKDPIGTFHEIESAARDEIIRCGGSLSHHHGVGKLRKKWLPEMISPVGVSLLKALKNKVDPKNIMANGNLIDVDDTPSQASHASTTTTTSTATVVASPVSSSAVPTSGVTTAVQLRSAL